MSKKVEAIARQVYESLDARDYARAVETLASGVLVLNVATGDVYKGREGFLEFVRSWAAAFPDARFRLLKVAGAEDRAMVEYELEGSQTGPLVTPRGHIPPTGMSLQLRFCDILEIRDGEIAHVRSYFDSSTLMRQLGLLAGTPLHAPDRRAPLELYAHDVAVNRIEQNRAIVQRFLQEVYNRQNPAAAADTCARTYCWHGAQLGETEGLAAYQSALAALFIAFPDLHLETLDMIAEGDRVALRFSMSGTHLGNFQGVAPTSKRIVGQGVSTYRMEGGRIAEEWWQADLLAIMQQLDAGPRTVALS